MSPPQVLYVGGWGRSGSTLLSHLLGRLPEMVAVGELRYVWQAGVSGNELCGCGQPFDECPFWVAVGEEAFGGWDKIDLDEVLGFGSRCAAPQQNSDAGRAAAVSGTR